jgi:hypothetical protein
MTLIGHLLTRQTTCKLRSKMAWKTTHSSSRRIETLFLNRNIWRCRTNLKAQDAVLFKIKTARCGPCPKLVSEDWHLVLPDILMHAMHVLLPTHRLLKLQNLLMFASKDYLCAQEIVTKQTTYNITKLQIKNKYRIRIYMNSSIILKLHRHYAYILSSRME